MIPFTGFGKLRKLPVTPIIISSVDNNAPDTCAMATDPLGSRLNHYIGAMFQRTKQVSTSTKSIVNDQGQIIFLCKCGNLFKVGNIQPWISDCLQVKCLGIFVNVFYKTLN